jgi:hypothetical protein
MKAVAKLRPGTALNWIHLSQRRREMCMGIKGDIEGQYYHPIENALVIALLIAAI